MSSSHVSCVTQGLGDLSGIPEMSHGGNKGNIREQERIFSSANISWPPAAEWLEQRESPLPLNRTGNRAREAELHNSVLSEYSCHRTGESKESPDCLYLKSWDRSQPLQRCLQCLLPYSPGDPSPSAGQAHQTNYTHNLTSTISCAIVNERKLRYNSSRAHSPFPRQRLISTPFSLNKFPSAVAWSHSFDVTPCPALLPSSLSPNHLPKSPPSLPRQCPKCSLQSLLVICPEQPTPK